MSSVECSDCKGLRENCNTCQGWAYNIRQQEEEELSKNKELATLLFFPGCGSKEPKVEKNLEPKEPLPSVVPPVAVPTTPFEGWTITDLQRRVRSLPVSMHGGPVSLEMSKEEAYKQIFLRLVGTVGLLANGFTSPLFEYTPDAKEVFITELIITAIMLTTNLDSPMDLQKAIEFRIKELTPEKV